MKFEHSKRTLMGYSKADLVEYCVDLEHNNQVLKDQFEVQYKNCMKIIEDMSLLNKTYEAVLKGAEHDTI